MGSSSRIIEIRLLGTVDVRERGGGSLQSVIAQPKRMALLAYLAAARPYGLHQRETLLALFWPDADMERARKALRQSLYYLKASLGGDALVTVGDAEVGVSASRIWCDVVELAHALDGRPAEACELYAGEMMPGFHIDGAPEFEKWLDVERSWVRQRAADAASRLVLQNDSAGDHAKAIDWARRAADLAPGDERVVCQLMEQLRRVGDRASAIRVYDEHVAVLRREYDLAPSAETTELAESIRHAPDRTGVKPILPGSVAARSLAEPGPAARTSVDIMVVRPQESVDASRAADASQVSDRRVASRRHVLYAAGVVVIVIALFAPNATRRTPALDPPMLITSLYGFESHPDISPAADRIVFSWDEGGGLHRHLYVVPAGNAGVPVRLTEGEVDDTYATWSPDGSEIAFLRARDDESRVDVMIMPAFGGPSRRVATTSWAGGLDWSPDGRSLAFTDEVNRGEPARIFLLSIETGQRTQLTHTSTDNRLTYDTDPVFSPNSRTLAFLRRSRHSGGLAQAHTIGITDKIAASIGVSDFRWDLDWENDNALIVSAGDYSSRYLLRIPVNGDASERLALGSGAFNISVDRKSGILVYSQHAQDHDIWRIPGPAWPGGGAPEKLIASTRDDLMPSYSPVTGDLAFISARSGNWEVWIADYDGRNERALTELGHAIFPSWYPDGRTILFSSVSPTIPNALSDVFSIDAAGGFPTNVTNDDQEDAIPTISHDGHWIYFQSRRDNHGWQIWRKPSARGEPEKVADRPALRPHVTISGRIYYSGERGTVWTVVPGESPRQFLRGVSWTEWTTWNDVLVFVQHTDSTTRFLTKDLHSGRTDILRELPRFDAPLPGRVDEVVRSAAIITLTVTADGRWIAYSKLEHAGSDLLLLRDIR